MSKKQQSMQPTCPKCGKYPFQLVPHECTASSETPLQKHLFRNDEELLFKRQFAIQWLASMEAMNYLDNCHRGWSDHSMLIEDAKDLADKAWEEWKDKIGVVG